VLAKRNILSFIQELNSESKVTIMLTSHDMSELEQLAGRIVMIDHGTIAFDGDFQRLRRDFGDRRHLLLETATSQPPVLEEAKLVKSEAGRHEYTFDAARVDFQSLLAEASRQAQILDVETHRAPIDDVIADIYERWQTAPAFASPQ
jgi:ABC-2 type transport system ATP-binding protein